MNGNIISCCGAVAYNKLLDYVVCGGGEERDNQWTQHKPVQSGLSVKWVCIYTP